MDSKAIGSAGYEDRRDLVAMIYSPHEQPKAVQVVGADAVVPAATVADGLAP